MARFSTFLLLLALQSCLILGQDTMYKLVLLSQDRGASCLDGSAPGIYVHEGSGANKQNYLLHFEGGGFCGGATLADTLQQCYKRSFSDLGSSSKYPASLSGAGMGALSPLSQQNPLFFDWTKIAIKYCDGHEYVGHRQVPIQFKDRNLYFRGSRNAKEVFHYLSQKYDFYNGGKIVIGGGSAGGICAYEWVNYLYDNTKKAKVYGTSDSGFFITNYESPIYHIQIIRTFTQPLMNLVFNATQTPEPILKCLENKDYDAVDCINAANFAKFIKPPLFIIQSPYDQFSIKNIVGASCPTNKKAPYSLQKCDDNSRKAIEDYRMKSLQALKSMRGDRKDVGIWGPACVQHGYEHEKFAYNNDNFKVNGVTLMKALQSFIKDPENAPWLLDEIPWPENVGCNGLANLRIE